LPSRFFAFRVFFSLIRFPFRLTPRCRFNFFLGFFLRRLLCFLLSFLRGFFLLLFFRLFGFLRFLVCSSTAQTGKLQPKKTMTNTSEELACLI